MSMNVTLINSQATGFSFPATWQSEWIDLGSANSSICSFHIWWEDVTLTFYLYKDSFGGTAIGNPPNIDFTADYRLIDPAWVDPLLGDVEQSHIVAFKNVGAQYVKIGYSASNWTGANRLLKISLWKDQQYIAVG